MNVKTRVGCSAGVLAAGLVIACPVLAAEARLLDERVVEQRISEQRTLDPRTAGTRLPEQRVTEAVADTVEQRRTTLNLEQWRADGALTARDIQITDLDGRDLSASARQRVDGSELQVAVPEQQREYVVRLKEVAQLRLPERRTVLPGGVVRNGAQGETAAWFRPTIMASPLPVAWNPERRRYSTRVFLGLEPPDDEPATELSRPIVMRLSFRGMQADPVQEVRLAQAGLEHEEEVELLFLPTTPQPVLEVRSTVGDVDLAMDVLPRLELRPVGNSVPGFGLGTATFEVVRLHPHGAEAAVDEDTHVSLQIGGGARPESAGDLMIPAGQSRTRFVLRSGGLGPLTVTADAGGLMDERTISQEFPLAPLIAAVGGGALGGYSRRFRKNAQPVSGVTRILEGLLVALVAYAASVLGVGWLQLPEAVAATVAGAFLTGALAGFVGVSIIETITSRRSEA